NGDGNADALWTTSADLYVALGNGDGSFQGALTYDTRLFGGTTVTGAFADFNNDGRIDVLVHEASAGIHVVLGNTDGSFTAPQQTATGIAAPLAAPAGDLNGDGILDVVVTDNVGIMHAYFGIGDGTFTAGASHAMGHAR